MAKQVTSKKRLDSKGVLTGKTLSERAKETVEKKGEGKTFWHLGKKYTARQGKAVEVKKTENKPKTVKNKSRSSGSKSSDSKPKKKGETKSSGPSRRPNNGKKAEAKSSGPTKRPNNGKKGTPKKTSGPSTRPNNKPPEKKKPTPKKVAAKPVSKKSARSQTHSRGTATKKEMSKAIKVKRTQAISGRKVTDRRRTKAARRAFLEK